MNTTTEYVATQKRTLDITEFKSNVKPLVDKYLRYQKVSMLHITHFLPRMGEDHPEFVVKGQLKELSYPKRPIVLQKDFTIPVDFSSDDYGALRGLECKIYVSCENCR